MVDLQLRREPIAYLNSEYPSLSHTFIQREVEALRRRGLDIRTYSIRQATETGTLGAAHRKEADTTTVLRVGWLALAAELICAIVRSPVAVLRSLVASQQLSPEGTSFRRRHFGYVVQGIRLARLLQSEGIRHIHVHMANNGAATAMMACKFDRRLSYSLSIHGSAEFFHVDTWKLREKAENAVFVRCISHFCRSQVMAWTESKTWHHCHVVRCGVNPFDFQPRPDSFTRRLRVLTIGRLHSIKGFDVFLEACHFLAATGIDFDVKMIGEGPLKGNLQKRIVQLCLSSQVRLIGAVSQEDIGRYFDQADVLVVSSFMEGIPVVLMEAMSKELCVIASHVGGVPELVEHGRHGFLVAPGSPEALAQALRAYAEDPSLRRMHGRCGRQRILQAYTTDMMADGMIRLFDTYGQLYKCE